MLRSIALWLFRLYAVRANAHVHKSVHIGIGTIIGATHRLDIDRDTYIGKGCTIQVNGSIGKGVLIANAVGIVGRNDHDYSAIGTPVRLAPWIGDADYALDRATSEVVIEDDVWIGYGSVILSPVRIGRGAIVAAGAVVIRDVEPYAIVAGAPARRAGQRFTEAQITEHERGLEAFWARRQG
jgi:acetyltransferase-like isoleucine patch superfamily enzyme